MKRLSLAVFFVVLLIVSGDVAQAASNRVALVIGNGAYQHAVRLPNPTNDAIDIARALASLGFEVIEGRDLEKRAMEDKIREFGRKLQGASIALFFYAGHGMQVGGRNYLLPIDAKLERAGDLAFETLDVSAVLGQMEAERRVNLVFLDACRDNPLARSFARSLGTRSTSTGLGLATIQSAVGTMIAYATQPDAVALDGQGRNSPFTSALLRHVATPGLEISSLMKRVRADVVEATREKQVPWDHSSLMGDVFLVPGTPAAPPPAGSIPDRVARDFGMAEQVNTAEAWRAFLRVYPTGFFAERARDRLAALTPPSAVVATFAGTFAGTVNRKFTATGQSTESRHYTVVFNADHKSGTVVILSSGVKFELAITGEMKDGRTFVGKTSLLRSRDGATYTPDEIRLEFSADGKTVRWFHSDGRLEGSGTLTRS